MPLNPAPATIASQLIERLAVVASTPALDNLEIQRITRDANTLMQSHPAVAHTVLGGIAALHGDAEESRSHHRVALTLDRSLVVRFNYSISLSLLEEHEEALEVVRDTLRDFPDDVRLLNHGIHNALDSGNFVTARAYCDRWDRLVPADPNPLSERARQLADAIDAGIFGEQGVRDVLKILADVQRREHVRTTNTAITPKDPPGSFLYERTILATPTVASNMNWRMVDQIVSSSELMADPGLKFTVAFVGSITNGGYT